MSGYNYDKFSPDHYTLDDFQGPVVGGKAQDFTMQTTDGGARQLLDFDGDFLVLEMASITCPLYQDRRNTMKALTEKHPDTSFEIMYVREAHPGANRPKHGDATGKLANAYALQHEDGEGRLILIDTLDGDAHAAYGSFPNAVFIINKNGCVVYYSDWNNPRATGRALQALKAGKPASGMGMFVPPKPPHALKTLRDAGKGSAVDFFRGLPVLIWKNLIKRNLRLLTGLKAKVAPDATC